MILLQKSSIAIKALTLFLLNESAEGTAGLVGIQINHDLTPTAEGGTEQNQGTKGGGVVTNSVNERFEC